MKYHMHTLGLWIGWKWASARVVLLSLLSLVYGPSEPLPSVLRAGVEASIRGERYATAVRQAEKADRLRLRRTVVAARLEARSSALAQSGPQRHATRG